MACSADQIEKHTLVQRLSVSIYQMSDSQIRRLLAIMEQRPGAESWKMNDPARHPAAGQDNALHRQMMIARLFVLIKQLDNNSLLARLRVFNHPDFRWVRQFPRMKCYLVVDFAAQGKAHRGYIRDISAGGVFIETSEPFEINQEVALCFTLAEFSVNLPLKIKGQIMGVYPDGIGVRYNSMPDQQLDIIDNLIKKSN